MTGRRDTHAAELQVPVLAAVWRICSLLLAYLTLLNCFMKGCTLLQAQRLSGMLRAFTAQQGSADVAARQRAVRQRAARH